MLVEPNPGLAYRRALAVGGRVRQVALRNEVEVRVQPRAARRVDEAAHGMRARAAGVDADQRADGLPLDVLVQADLDRRLAVAGEVVGEAEPRRDVMPVDERRFRQRDVGAVRRQQRLVRSPPARAPCP